MRSDREGPQPGDREAADAPPHRATGPEAPRPADARPAPAPLPRPAVLTSDGAPREQVVQSVLPALGPTAMAATPLADAPPATPAPPAPPPVLPVVDVETLDWAAVRRAVDPAAVRARMADTLDRLEARLDRADGPGFLFDADRAGPDDRAIHVRRLDDDAPLWFVGDLHGDLLTLEAAVALARTRAAEDDAPPARFVLLGDLFDDGGYGLEVLLRVFELLVDAPAAVCVLAGNHDEALRWDGDRFSATVSPSDFTDWLNARLDDALVVRAGRLAVRLFARAPRALFLPDGLLVTHGGFPLVDLHAELEASGDWNDPRALQDFTWTRAHPKARKKLPNRASRGSQFGREDFAAFCALAARLGRRVTHVVRGHDHEEERFAIPPAWTEHPLLTTVAMSRRLPREAFGPYERVPTVARWVPGALPQVHRLHVPPAMVRELFPEPAEPAGPAEQPSAPVDGDGGGAA